MTDASLIETGPETDFTDYIALLKPRVMSLVVFTALVGLLVAPIAVNPVITFASVLFIAIGGGASGALNMWWESDIDAIMKRTQGRPIPSGRITRDNALIFGLWLSVIAVGMLGLTANYLAAGILAFTIFFYAVVYTMWLKRATPLNIVIGGAAGAFPPMIGWAVATGSIGIESILMFALIFMWTPPHFWALALFMNDDYTKAGVPMLPVTHGRRVTRNNILGYTIALVPVAMAISFTSIGGPIYFAAALVLNMLFLKGAYDIWKRTEEQATADKHATERKVFRISLYYLFLHFAVLLVEATAKSYGLNWAAWPQWI